MEASYKRDNLLLESSLLSAAFFLGTNPVAVKYAIGELSPLPFVALRFTLAGLLLLVILHLLHTRAFPEVRDLLAMAAIGIMGVGLNNVMFTLGVSQTTASETALIYATPPLWGMLLAFTLGLESPRMRGVLGVMIALLGVFVVVYWGLGTGGSSFVGDLLVMGGAICWGSYTVTTLRLLRKYPPLTVAAYTIFFAGLAVSVFALPGLASTDWGSLRAGTWAAVAYTTGPVAAYAFFVWQRGVSRIGANRVLVYQYLVTLVGTGAGVLLLKEDLTINKILGGVIILFGIYLART